MDRLLWACAAALLAVAPCAGADEAGRLEKALPFEQLLQAAIKEAEPSIASILVSRSDAYRKYFPDNPAADILGKLGTFDPTLPATPKNGEPAPRPVEIKKLDLADPVNVPESYGSGVVIDKGLVLTNYHVIRGAIKIYVRFPGGKGSYADIHAADWRSDLAVLRVLDDQLATKAIKLGDGGKVEPGGLILSIANPYTRGFRDARPVAAWGLVSSVRRRLPSPPAHDRDDVDIERERSKTLHHYGNLLQLDTRLNTGCSGGAVLNLKGELIALSSALAALSGTEMPGGFAVPMDDAMQGIVRRLSQGKEVEYGFLGVGTDPHRLGGEGVTVTRVTEGSPAWDAGIRQGDAIVAVGDRRVQDMDDLFLAVGTLLAGSEPTVEYVRPPREHKKVTVKLAKFYMPPDKKSIASNRGPAPRGLRVDYASTLVQRAVGMIRIPPGVVVREVVPGSPADAAKLQVDRVITRVGDRTVNTPAEFYEEMEKSKGAVELLLLNLSGGSDKVKIPMN